MRSRHERHSRCFAEAFVAVPRCTGIGGGALELRSRWVVDHVQGADVSDGGNVIVETRGLEPLTPALQRQCSAS